MGTNDLWDYDFDEDDELSDSDDEKQPQKKNKISPGMLIPDAKRRKIQQKVGGKIYGTNKAISLDDDSDEDGTCPQNDGNEQSTRKDTRRYQKSNSKRENARDSTIAVDDDLDSDEELLRQTKMNTIKTQCKHSSNPPNAAADFDTNQRILKLKSLLMTGDRLDREEDSSKEDSLGDMSPIVRSRAKPTTVEKPEKEMVAVAPQDTPAAAGGKIDIEIQDKYHKRQTVTVRVDKPLLNYFDKIQDSDAFKGWIPEGTRKWKFLFDGDEILPGQTAKSLDIEENDSIDIIYYS